jgi:hypothetical protein
MYIRLLILTIATLFLTACHHLSETECRMMNWKQEGIRDGNDGKSVRNLSDSVEDCQKFGLSVDTPAYTAGYAIGIKQYCTPSQDLGQQHGVAGKSIDEINARQSFCVSNMQTLDLKHYNIGFKKGLAAFCTRDNGYAEALAGKTANPSCPASEYPYMNGWEAGTAQFCGNKSNGFVYGKEGKPYPDACRGPTYPDFKLQYDRGVSIKQREEQMKSKINELNSNIDSQVTHYGLRSNAGNYSLGENKTSEAWNALYSVQNMAYQRDELKNELFKNSLIQ